MELKGSKTEQNLMAEFFRESPARKKYSYFASQSKKNNYKKITVTFKKFANNEKKYEKRDKRLLKNTKNKIMFLKEGDPIWIYCNFLHITADKKMPKLYPIC